MSAGHRTNESARTRLGVAIALFFLASAAILALVFLGVGSGTVSGTALQNESGPPELHSGEKINDTAVELVFVDDSGIETGSINREDFLLSDGSIQTLDVQRVRTNATVVLRLDSPLDTDELTVGVRPGSDIRDLDGNEIETSDGPPSVTITGMDGVPPRPLGTNVTDARGRPAHVGFNFDEPLQGITVEINGPAPTVLTIEDFENPSGSRYVAEYDPPEDGDYELVLVNATDMAGNTRDIGVRRTITANRSTPRTVVGIDFAASEGLNITFDGGQSDDSVVNFTWRFGDGTTATGERVTHEFDPGVYTVTLVARDGHGNVGRDQVELTLTDGLDVVSDGETNASERPLITVDRSRSTADAMVTVLDAFGGRPVRIGAVNESGDAILSHESFTLDGLTVTPTENLSFRLALSASGPNSVADAGPNGSEAIGGLAVINDAADSHIESVEFTFSVDADRIDALDIAPENVTLYREHDGDWQPLATSVVSRTARTYRFETLSPGFSRFAILGADAGARDDGSAPSVAVTDVELNGTTIDAGATVEITATVENQGGTTDFVAGLGVDGTLLETRTVPEIPGGETVPVTFVRRFDDPGTYTLAVNGTEAEPLTVERSDEGGGESNDDETSDETNEDGSDETDKEGSDGTDEGSDGTDNTDGEDEGASESSDSGNFEVTEVTVNETDIEPGETVEITANVENGGEQIGNFTAGLEIDGELVAVRAVPKVPRSTSIPAKFERTFDEKGTYTVSVNGTASRQPVAVGQTSGGGLLGFLPLGLLRTVFLFLGAPLLVVYLALKAVAFYMGY